EDALKYLRKALDAYAMMDDTCGQARIMNNISEYFLRVNEYDSVIYYADLSLSMRPKDNSYARGAAISEYNKGLAYRELSNMDLAIGSFKKAADLFLQVGDRKSVVYPYSAMVELYRKMGDLDKAIQLAPPTLEAVRASQSKGALRDLYRTLSNLYAEKGDYERAYYYTKEHLFLNDTILNEESSRQLIEMETKYETEEKEQQIANLEQEKLIANLRIQQQNAILLGGLAFVLVLTFAGYAFYRNRTLRLDQKRLMTEQRLLRSQMNPHFLFNALSAIHSYVFQGDKIKAGEYLSIFSGLTRDILDHSGKEWVSLNEEIQTLEKYLQVQQIRFPGLVYELGTNELELDIIQFPPLLLQPFVENAIEHGFKGREEGKIEINIQKEEGSLKIKICDDGRGLDNNLEAADHESKAITIATDRLNLLFGSHLKQQLSVRNRPE
ncbi:MAG: histidine kinase, partial [Bacteroidota bacterium]